MDTVSAVLLNNLREMTPRAFHALLAFCPDPGEAVKAGPRMWGQRVGLDDSTVEKLESDWRFYLEQAKREVEKANKEKVRLVWFRNNDYPPLLKEITFPPPLLFVKGDLAKFPPILISMVGTRRPTYYGEKAASLLATEIGREGIGIVSGLARGVDKIAHESAIRAQGWTAAVLGSGFDFLYPKEHTKLAEKITENGVVMSEFGMATQPFPGNFPRRNRIVSGISYGTIVIEGNIKSGSLITARLAANQGREVFALPGPIFSQMSSAPNYLISQGAKLITSSQDVLAEFGYLIKNKKTSSKKTKPQGMFKRIQEFLGASAVPKEAVAQKFNLRPEELARVLVDMELDGLLKTLPGGYLSKTS